MKKLMFAASAALIAAVGLGVESGNVVGYTTTSAFRAKNTMFTPMFTGVSATTYSVQDMVPVASSGTVPDGSNAKNRISFQKLTAEGGADGKIVFWKNYTDDEDEEDIIVYNGWYEGTATSRSSMTFRRGEAFWINCPSDNVAFQFSGEVTKGDVYFALRQGNNAVGNPFPQTIRVKDIVLVGENIPDGSNAKNRFSFQKLTAEGGADGKIVFWKNYTDDEDEEDIIVYNGWYEGTSTSVSSMTLTAGEGVWLYSPNATTSLKFPKVLDE